MYNTKNFEKSIIKAPEAQTCDLFFMQNHLTIFLNNITKKLVTYIHFQTEMLSERGWGIAFNKLAAPNQRKTGLLLATFQAEIFPK